METKCFPFTYLHKSRKAAIMGIRKKQKGTGTAVYDVLNAYLENGNMETVEKFQFSISVSWQEEKTKGFIYIYDIKTRNYFKLESVGKDVWLGIFAGMTLQDIIREISDKYKMEKNIVAEDVQALINSLLLKGLIVNLF